MLMQIKRTWAQLYVEKGKAHVYQYSSYGMAISLCGSSVATTWERPFDSQRQHCKHCEKKLPQMKGVMMDRKLNCKRHQELDERKPVW